MTKRICLAFITSLALTACDKEPAEACEADEPVALTDTIENRSSTVAELVGSLHGEHSTTTEWLGIGHSETSITHVEIEPVGETYTDSDCPIDLSQRVMITVEAESVVSVSVEGSLQLEMGEDYWHLSGYYEGQDWRSIHGDSVESFGGLGAEESVHSYYIAAILNMDGEITNFTLDANVISEAEGSSKDDGVTTRSIVLGSSV